MSDTLFWLILGAILIMAETFFIPGVGLLFGGIGAIITAIIVYFGYAETSILQSTIFFGISVISGILLWKPFKKLHSSKSGYSNIVGSTAIVSGNGLKAGTDGEVKWSGTNMLARLSASAVPAEIPAGSEVVILEIQGNVLIVAPK